MKPVVGIKHHTSWLRAAFANQYAMNCAVVTVCRQFSHLPVRLSGVRVIHFLTFSINRQTGVQRYTVIINDIGCICIASIGAY